MDDITPLINLLEHALAFGACAAVGFYFGVSRRMSIKVKFHTSATQVTHHMTEHDND